jgi:hypothetical protein
VAQRGSANDKEIWRGKKVLDEVFPLLSSYLVFTNTLYEGSTKVPFTSRVASYAATASVNDSGKSPSLPRDPGLPAK